MTNEMTVNNSPQGPWTILRDDKRYPGMDTRFPIKIVVYGTAQEAVNLASYLSNFYAGCDLLFFVEGITEDQVASVHW